MNQDLEAAREEARERPVPEDVTALCEELEGLPRLLDMAEFDAVMAVARRAEALLRRLASAEAERDHYRTRKDEAYQERNQVVAALAHIFPSGTARTEIPSWDAEWHGCVYIDLPTGQVSWHYHDSQAHLFAQLPPYAGKWDGHDTPEKYRRLACLQTHPAEAALEECRGALATFGVLATAFDPGDRLIVTYAGDNTDADLLFEDLAKAAALAKATAQGGTDG